MLAAHAGSEAVAVREITPDAVGITLLVVVFGTWLVADWVQERRKK